MTRINYLKLAAKARNVKKLQDSLELAMNDLDLDLVALNKEANATGLTLWRRENKTVYFWENRHGDRDMYDTLVEAILAYGSEQLKFD